MLRQATYDYLRHLLLDERRVALIPAQHAFGGGFVAQHGSCHLTAMQIAFELGYEPVLGVLFLQFQGTLSPWAHIVNRVPGGQLLDFSPQVTDIKLGFVEVGWSEFHRWRDILADYHTMDAMAGGRFNDPLADKLADEFLPLLIDRPDFASCPE